MFLIHQFSISFHYLFFALPRKISVQSWHEFNYDLSFIGLKQGHTFTIDTWNGYNSYCRMQNVLFENLQLHYLIFFIFSINIFSHTVKHMCLPWSGHMLWWWLLMLWSCWLQGGIYTPPGNLHTQHVPNYPRHYLWQISEGYIILWTYTALDVKR